MSLSTSTFCGTGKAVELTSEDAKELSVVLHLLLEGNNLCISGKTARYVSNRTKLSVIRIQNLLNLCKKIIHSGLILYKGQNVHWNPGLSRFLYFDNCNSLNDCYLEAMNYIYQQNIWRDSECKSGTGSGAMASGGWINTITTLQKKLRFSTWVDLCCGQFRLDVAGVIAPYFDAYLGMDISSNIIRENKEKFSDLLFRQTELTKAKISQTLDEEKITQPALITIKHALQHMDKTSQLKVLEMVLKTFPMGSVLVFTTFALSVLDEDVFDIIPGGTISNCSFKLLERNGLLVDGIFANCSIPLPDAEYVRGDGTCAVVLQITAQRKFAPLN